VFWIGGALGLKLGLAGEGVFILIRLPLEEM
jgi:hypothetical protein